MTLRDADNLLRYLEDRVAPYRPACICGWAPVLGNRRIDFPTRSRKQEWRHQMRHHLVECHEAVYAVVPPMESVPRRPITAAGSRRLRTLA